MAVSSSDLIVYLSANRPEADTTTSGGAIDATMRLLLRANSDTLGGGSGDRIDLVSTSGSDTQNVVIAGYGTDGTWIEETVTLAGTTNVQSVATFLHLRKVQAATAAAGVVTVAEYNGGDPSALFTIPVAEKGAACLFLKATANAGGGATKTLYEKIFVKNAHATDTLVNAIAYLSADEDTELKIDAEMASGATVTGGSETTANRATKPTTGGTYTFADHATEGAAHDLGDAEDGNLIAGEAQGIWVELTLAAGRTPEQQVQWALTATGDAS
jgi:hypothetical protein